LSSAIEQRTVDCLVDNEWEEMWVGVTELVVLSSEFLSVTEEDKVTPGYLLFPTEFEPCTFRLQVGSVSA